MSVVYLTFLRMGMMSCERTGRCGRDASCATATVEERTTAAQATVNGMHFMIRLPGGWIGDVQRSRLERMFRQDGEAICDAVTLEVLRLSSVVAGRVVAVQCERNPRLTDLLGRLRLRMSIWPAV